MWKLSLACYLGLTLVFVGPGKNLFAADSVPAPIYQNNFETAEVGKAPEDFMIIDGAFTVASEAGNKFYELPGSPLESFGTLFGPSRKDGIQVGARIFGTSKGRRFPVMGIGLNGVGGYRLQLVPAKKVLELVKNDQVLESVSFTWESGHWYEFQLRLAKVKESEWKLSGKVWKSSASQPADWLIQHAVTEAPIAGQASIWGKPYSETPIRFDDLSVKPVSP